MVILISFTTTLIIRSAPSVNSVSAVHTMIQLVYHEVYIQDIYITFAMENDKIITITNFFLNFVFLFKE